MDALCLSRYEYAYGAEQASEGEAIAVDVSLDRRDGVLFIAVSGRLESADATGFLKTVKAEIEKGDRALIMDFEQLRYISSAGLRVVYMAASELEKRYASFSLCSPPAAVAEVIRISGMDQLVAVHPSREDALAAL